MTYPARPVKSPELRRRNRRVATILITALIIATALCAIWIAFFGGLKKGPMEPYHSGAGPFQSHSALTA